MTTVNRKRFRETLRFGIGMFATTPPLAFAIDFIITVLRSGIGMDIGIWGWIYYIISSLGHAALLSVIVFTLVYLPAALLSRRRNISAGISTVVLIIIQTLLILNIFVFSLYRFHINGFVLNMAVGGGTEVFEFDATTYLKFGLLVFAGAILPFIAGQILYTKIYRKINFRYVRITWIVLMCCLAFSHIFYTVAAARRNSQVRKAATALPYFYPLSANKLLVKLGVADPDKFNPDDFNRFSSDIVYPLKPLSKADSIPEYNILYILIDSWNPSAYDSIVTPNIYSFASQGETFLNHHSSSNGTQGSIFGLFFGLAFTYEKEFSISKVSPLFIDRMLECGYDINTFPSATFKRPPFHEMIFRRVPGIMTGSQGSNAFERDGYITRKFHNFLDNRQIKEPFFAFLFYDLPHASQIPAEYRTVFTPSLDEPDYMGLKSSTDPLPYFNLYRNCVHHTDYMIGGILDRLRENGMLENTVVIITGDHGQEFNENGKNYWGHGSNFSKWQTQVPFILYHPDADPGTSYDHMTTHYDITPTVMKHFLGVSNEPGVYSMGYDIYETVSRYPHIVGDHVNYGFVFENAIITTNHMGTLEMTDHELEHFSRDDLDPSDLISAIEKRNRFFNLGERKPD